MPVFRIPEEHLFPHPSLAEVDGLLGVGGDLHPRRLLLAYANGIFPWYNEGQPILWFSPDPRFVVFPDRFHVGRSLKKTLRKAPYRITMDTAFEEVIDACKGVPRPGQRGTWITRDMRKSYVDLHHMGLAHSVEAWEGQNLVGGLYGVALGGLYSGESMFARRPDASKVAFVWMVRHLFAHGIELVDCQVHTDHLERFGAINIARDRYLEIVADLMARPTETGCWSFDEGFDPLAPGATDPQSRTADSRSR